MDLVHWSAFEPHSAMCPSGSTMTALRHRGAPKGEQPSRPEMQPSALVMPAHPCRVSVCYGQPRPWDPRWATSSAGAEWRRNNPPPLTYLGALKRRRTYPHLGLILDPPPPDATPRVDPAAAARIYAERGACIYGSAGPEMHLAVAGGGTLVYFLHADGLRLPMHGPAPGPGEQRPRGTLVGTAIGLLDADAGTWIKQVQSAGPWYARSCRGSRPDLT